MVRTLSIVGGRGAVGFFNKLLTKNTRKTTATDEKHTKERERATLQARAGDLVRLLGGETKRSRGRVVSVGGAHLRLLTVDRRAALRLLKYIN